MSDIPDVIDTETPVTTRSGRRRRKSKKKDSTEGATTPPHESDLIGGSEQDGDGWQSPVTTPPSGNVTARSRIERFRSISYKGPKSEFSSFLKTLKKELNYPSIIQAIENINHLLLAEADLIANPGVDQDAHDNWTTTAAYRRGKMVNTLTQQKLTRVVMVKDGILGRVQFPLPNDPTKVAHASLCMQFTSSLLDSLAIQSTGSEDDHEKEQKKADRIKKNKAAFYPAKLSHASELRPFLRALMLECERIPMWDRCVKFDHQLTNTYKTKEKLFAYLKFHNDSSCVESMTKHNFHLHDDEACYSLYLAIMASLSDEIIEEISLYRDEYKLNGPALLVKLIEMLSPSLQEIRLETGRYFDNLLEDLRKSKWDVMTKAAEIKDMVNKRRNAGGSTEDLYSKVTNAFAHCDDHAFKSHHSQFVQKNPSPNPNGDTVLEYLFHATRVTKKLILEGTWKCTIPKHHNKSNAPASKKRKSDDADIAAFAASAKKMKQEYEAKLKAKDNTIKQLKDKTALKSDVKTTTKPPKSKHPKAPGAPRATEPPGPSQGRPPKGMYSKFVSKEYYGENCTYTNQKDWRDFVTGDLLTHEQKKIASKHGYSVQTTHGQFLWFWCATCGRMGGHKSLNCKNREHTSGPAPSAYVATAPPTKKAKIEEESVDDGEVDSSDDDSEFETDP